MYEGWKGGKVLWHKRMLVIVCRRHDKIGKSPFCKQCKNWFKQASPNYAKNIGYKDSHILKVSPTSYLLIMKKNNIIKRLRSKLASPAIGHIRTMYLHTGSIQYHPWL